MSWAQCVRFCWCSKVFWGGNSTPSSFSVQRHEAYFPVITVGQMLNVLIHLALQTHSVWSWTIVLCELPVNKSVDLKTVSANLSHESANPQSCLESRDPTLKRFLFDTSLLKGPQCYHRRPFQNLLLSWHHHTWCPPRCVMDRPTGQPTQWTVPPGRPMVDTPTVGCYKSFEMTCDG